MLISILAAQQVYSLNRSGDLSFLGHNSDVHLSFEVDDFVPGIFGDVPAGQIVVNQVIDITNCLPGTSKSKDIQTGITFSVVKTNLIFAVVQSSVFTRSCAVFVPIYLQAASFLL